MQQIIYGETHKKTKVLDRSKIEAFLEKNTLDYSESSREKTCIYTSLGKTINDPTVNYLNIVSKSNIDNQLKSLLRMEYEKLEKYHPKLGSVFLEYFFDNISLDGESFLLHKDEIENFTSTLENNHVKLILKQIIENASLEYNVEIQPNLLDEIVFVKTKNINFRTEYDSDFLGRKNKHVIKNFKHIIIDGQIESIGEIYHLLYKAAETKIPYVIFCFGMSREVKDVIIQNNSKGYTEIMPVCLKFDENTINILNDLSVVFESDIVTAQKGQTISQEVRNELNYGKQIEFDRGGFSIQPNASEESIRSHRLFLEKRISDSKNQTNKHLLDIRMKRMSSKSLKLYLPESLLSNPNFLVELDYVLRFLNSSSMQIKKIFSKNSNKFYYLPASYLKSVKEISSSLKNVYDRIGKLILREDSQNAGI